ncbi:MAG TPA: hypothetical protein PKM58_06620 [Pyrinomonadaceae bacterium]|nr:hypothetical protein [Pyrinomonadaceae bacterium]
MNSGKQETEQAESKNNPRRKRVDRFFYYWGKFRLYRSLCTALLAFLVYLGARAYSSHQDPAQLKFVETASEQAHTSGTSAAEPVKPVLSGEVYETAVRLRESGALLMAISLSSFDEFRVNGKFPATSREILSGLQKRSLVPPGIEIKDGVLRSTLSELKLSYRAELFSFEILSLPINNAGGTAILFRFPLPPTEANSVMYFEAQNPVQLPTPFSTSEQITAAGWKIRHWRGEAMPLTETVVRDLREQDEWLKSQNQDR